MNNAKRVFDESKQSELKEYDTAKGKLVDDKLLIRRHKVAKEIKEQSHVEVIHTYENGGQDIQKVIDVPRQAAREAFDEYEDIFVFVPFTIEEIEQERMKKYRACIVAKIRKRYSLDDEIALARRRDAVSDEWDAYNEYCEQCKREVKEDSYNEI